MFPDVRDDQPHEEHRIVLAGVTWADYQRHLEGDVRRSETERGAPRHQPGAARKFLGSTDDECGDA